MKEVDLKTMRNADLLKYLLIETIAGDCCLRSHNIDAHGHIHTANAYQEEILSRMVQPEVVKLEVK